jgi:hypothetical protein
MVDDLVAERRAVEARGGKYELTLEEQIERFDETIGMRKDWEALALAQHRAWLESQGKEWDDTEVEQDWRMQDREIPGNYMGNPNDPARKGK